MRLELIKLLNIFFVGFVLLTSQAFGQGAWVAPKGTGSISISYLNDFSNLDYFGKGEHYIDVPGLGRATYFGDNRTQGIFFDFSYSFTDKLSLSASIPFLAAKYTAPPLDQQVNAIVAPHVFADGSIPLDDGNYHGNFQDLGLRLKYNISSSPLVITPYIEVGLPSNDYPFFSHAIVGSNLRSLGIGLYMGRTLDPFLPNTFLSGRYGYAWDEKVLGISRSRHVGELEAGYFVTSSMTAFMILVGQFTNGGLDGPNDFAGPGIGPADTTNPLFFHHTQIARENYLNVGLGGQYSLNERFALFGVVTRMLAARNLHGLTYGVNFGFSWSFGGSPQRPCHC